jgi:DNA-nicking Smr family endonuclease
VAGEFRRLLESHPQLEAGDHSSHRQPQVLHRILQRLRRGQYAIQDELDLHGATAQQAHRLLRDFIADARSTAMAACASSTARAINRTARHRC